MCVCIHVRMYVFVYVYYVRTCVCVCVRARVYMCVCGRSNITESIAYINIKTLLNNKKNIRKQRNNV